jgi:hypothetical protein
MGSSGSVALNVPTHSFLKEIIPQYTESNARPRKRTAHGNISRTELPKTQHSLITTVVGPLTSPRTETLRSQRYSQRLSNQTKRYHKCISTSPIPQPQTTTITCLSDPAFTNWPLSPKTNQQSVHGRQKITSPVPERGHAAKQKVSNIRP